MRGGAQDSSEMQTRVPSWKRIGLQLNNRVAEARREEVPSVTAAIVPPSQVSTNRSGEGRRGKHVHGRPDRSLDGDVESLRRHEHPELVRRSGLDVDPGANDGDGGERRQVQRHQDGDDHGDRTRRHDPVVDTEGHLAGPEKRDHRNKGTKMIHGDAEGRNRSRKEKKRRDRGAKTEEPEKTAVSTKEKKLRAPGLSLEPDLIEPEDVDPTAHLDAKHDGSVLLHDVPAADQQDAAEHEHTEQVQRDGDQDREFVEEVGVHEGRREGPDQVDGDQERAEEEDEGAEHRRNSSGEKKRKRDAVEGQPARKEKKKRKHARLEEETHADTKAVADIPKAPDAFSQSARPGTKQAAVQVDAKKRVRTIEQLDETDDRGFDGTKHGQSGSNQASTNARGTQIPQEKLGASEETRSVREQDAVATTRAITAIDPSENEDVSAFAHISVMDGVNETAAHVRAFGQIDPSRTSPQISPMRKPLIPTESNNSSPATKIKRRKLTSSISSSSIHIHPALTYLLDFYHQSTSWKFAKTRQAYLLKHFFDLKIIPESYSPALRAYIVGLKGDHPRGTLLKAALEIINIAMAPRRSSGGFTAKAGAIDTHGLTEEMLEGDFSKPATPKTSTSSSNTRARTSAAAANADPYSIDREQTEEEKGEFIPANPPSIAQTEGSPDLEQIARAQFVIETLGSEDEKRLLTPTARTTPTLTAGSSEEPDSSSTSLDSNTNMS